jgi:hypothetical protein
MAPYAHVGRAVAARMRHLGFRKWKSSFEYLIELGPGVEGWCGIPATRRGEHSRLSATIGIRCNAIEDRITAWCGDPVPGWQGDYITTVAMNIGYLMPQDQWMDYPVNLTEANADAGVQPLIADIANVGLPFMRSHALYDGLIDALITGRGRVGGPAIERLPLAHALDGDLTAAHHALDT